MFQVNPANAKCHHPCRQVAKPWHALDDSQRGRGLERLPRFKGDQNTVQHHSLKSLDDGCDSLSSPLNLRQVGFLNPAIRKGSGEDIGGFYGIANRAVDANPTHRQHHMRCIPD
jgi:hypothetical protein